MSSCWRCCCAPASRARACCRWPQRAARAAAAGFGGIAGLLHASAADLKRVKGLAPAKRAELVAVLELARRALASSLRERAVFETPDAVRTICSCTWRPPARGVRGAVPRRAAPADRDGRTVSRHADADQRLPARSRAARAAPPRRRRGAGAQPPERLGAAVARRRSAHADAEERARAGRCAGARPCHRRPPAQSLSMAEHGLCKVPST